MWNPGVIWVWSCEGKPKLQWVLQNIEDSWHMCHLPSGVVARGPVIEPWEQPHPLCFFLHNGLSHETMSQIKPFLLSSLLFCLTLSGLFLLAPGHIKEKHKQHRKPVMLKTPSRIVSSQSTTTLLEEQEPCFLRGTDESFSNGEVWRIIYSPIPDSFKCPQTKFSHWSWQCTRQ